MRLCGEIDCSNFLFLTRDSYQIFIYLPRTEFNWFRLGGDHNWLMEYLIKPKWKTKNKKRPLPLERLSHHFLLVKAQKYRSPGGWERWIESVCITIRKYLGMCSALVVYHRVSLFSPLFRVGREEKRIPVEIESRKTSSIETNLKKNQKKKPKKKSRGGFISRSK